MPLYFRRSFGRGPVRFNLSGRGLGVSVGVRGLRVGTGPRGAYVRAGRGGFYYQQYLRAPSTSNARPAHLTTTQPTDARDIGLPVLATAVEFVGEADTSPDEYVAEVNRRRAAFRRSNLVFGGALLLFGLLLTLAALPTAWSIIPLTIVAAGSVLRQKENAARALIFTYELDGDAAQKYGLLCDAIRTANGSAMVWRVATELAVDARRNGGATKVIDRMPTRVRFGTSEVKANVNPPVLALSAAKLAFMPDKVLFLIGARVATIPYSELRLAAQEVEFREDGPVPADATLVGMTWQFVNKNGSPDRRFKNNRQIPILVYSQLAVRHSSFGFVLEFSKRHVAARVAATLKLLGEA